MLAGWFLLSRMTATQDNMLQSQWSRDSRGTPFLRIASTEAPSRETRPTLVLVIHGLGGRQSVLIQLATELSHAGFDCTSIDLPGHGASADVFTWNRALGNTMSIVSDLLSERSSGAQPRLFL